MKFRIVIHYLKLQEMLLNKQFYFRVLDLWRKQQRLSAHIKQFYILLQDAGCSLSDGINGQDVRNLKKKYPGIPVACYINTTAEVKAECDVCVTSSNYLSICEKLPGNKLIFVPDKFMGKHLQESLKGKERSYRI